MAIANHHLLQIDFQFSWSALADKNGQAFPNQRDWLDRKNMYALADAIMDSLKVELSEEAKAQQKHALKDLEDCSLTTHYPPIDFSQTEASDPAPAVKRI